MPSPKSVTVRSFAKINLGLRLGPPRPDGFHELRTVYQTLAIHDRLKINVGRGDGFEILCNDPRVPTDRTNTCWKMAERVMDALKQTGKVTIEIAKRLPVQGGLGAASGNAIAVLVGLERALKKPLPPEKRLEIAAQVGSDVPLFLIGGAVLGLGRGEQVYPLPDFRPIPCVVVTPPIGVSTPQAFRDWDALSGFAPGQDPPSALTQNTASDTLDRFSHALYSWLMGTTSTGVSGRARNRAEAPLLDLVRAGIENDFERVVFPQHPELRDLKRDLQRAGARYASLSGSGSSLYGLFATRAAAERAARRLSAKGVPAIATSTLPRAQYWKKMSSRDAGRE
jgi:4-diphosphocytidyl-2-C-methyl-D-erythritol kinase